MLAPHQGQAQAYEPTEAEERVAIAFYKTGGVIPNFDRWVKETAPYIHTPWARRDKVYEEEILRLQMAYQNFNPNKEFLIVQTSIFLNLSEKEDEEGKKTYHLHTKFSEVPDALYFPYNFMAERIILMPYQLHETMNNEISKAQFDYIKKTVRANKQKINTVIRMKPFEADFSQPYEIDGSEQWVFKTKIASIELWDNKDNLIWEYTAPWYVSPHFTEIKEIFDSRPTNSTYKKGVVKPTYNRF